MTTCYALQVVQYIATEDVFSNEFDIHPLRARRTLWRAVSGLKPHCQSDVASNPNRAAEARDRSISSTRKKDPDDHSHAALSLLEAKAADWPGWASDGDLVQLLLEIADCSAHSKGSQPLRALQTNLRWRKLLGRLHDHLNSRLSGSASVQSQHPKAETVANAVDVGASSLLSRACSVLYACASLVSVPTQSAAGATTETEAAAETPCGHAAETLMSSPDAAHALGTDRHSASDNFHKLAELAAEVCHMQLQQVTRSIKSMATEDSIVDTLAGSTPGMAGSSPVLVATVAAMACNMLWSLGMLQQCIRPAITHPSLASECVTCLIGSLEDQRGPVQDGVLRQLCSYPSTAGKFISRAMHGASKLEPSCWISGSVQKQQRQQLKDKGHKLATLFEKIQLLCEEDVDCGGATPLHTEAEVKSGRSLDGANSSSSELTSTHKRRRRASEPRAEKMLKLSAQESTMLQEAKKICL